VYTSCTDMITDMYDYNDIIKDAYDEVVTGIRIIGGR